MNERDHGGMSARGAEARPSRVNGRPVGLVRGVLAERVVISAPADPFLDLQALEVYRSPAEIPAEYNATGNYCGAILLWTR